MVPHTYSLAQHGKESRLDKRVIGLVSRHGKEPPNKSVLFSLVRNSHICIGCSDVLVEQVPNPDLLGRSKHSILLNSFNACLPSLGGGRCIHGGV